ncbi:gliding motility lipoprotein GldD [Carboxylicivirga sediminis]|uniref:Gliding motility lipoprotein GldD n=1 Tax=Carboxylicivirga sediminis TaxID=2006564 RepID=A0A941IXL8_9BACT|nr:gliding motility lipoprotein GldD [Carboxylicivirga sediminis]MBR8534822.1 gliding motility lipoprotein GldD [Carboxylicivirga sediminis]
MLRVIMRLGLMLLVVMFVASACRQKTTPKPRGYFRIVLPEKDYQAFDQPFPYQFEYPSYAKAMPDTSVNAEAYWLNIVFPEMNGQIHISYKAVNDNFNDLLEDSRKLAYKHTIKADAINERMFYNEQKQVMGILYEIKGNAASPLQFFATDSLRHFIRGSLYFNAKPNQDSLAPVIGFVEEDVIRLMETLEWTNR